MAKRASGASEHGRVHVVLGDRVDESEPDASSAAKAGASARTGPASGNEEEPSEMWSGFCSFADVRANARRVNAFRIRVIAGWRWRQRGGPRAGRRAVRTVPTGSSDVPSTCGQAHMGCLGPVSRARSNTRSETHRDP